MTASLAIMQPTFLPWMGYFALLDYVDAFVFLDDVQFNTRSYQSRNRIKTSQGPLLITVPCRKEAKSILDVKIADLSIYNKLLRTVKQSYSKALHKHEVINVLEDVFSRNHNLLFDLNCQLIIEIASSLNIRTPIYRSSQLNVPNSKKELRLLNICQKLNADEYISAPGSLSYLKENNPFVRSNVKLKFFSFTHPQYPQLYGSFESHLSIIDAIANIGQKETTKLLRAGIRPSLNFCEATSVSSNSS